MTIEEKDDYLVSLYGSVIAREDSQGFENLPKKDQVLLCVLLLKAEVENGGFDQFFFNSGADRWRETIGALDAIGAVATRKMVEQGLALFPDSTPSSVHSERRDQMEEFADSEAEHFEKLDSLFYDSSEDLNSMLYDYLAKKSP